MDSNQDQIAFDFPTSEVSETEVERLALRERVVLDVNAATLDTIQQRVAWVLNHYPETRDSDVSLQVKYWEHFEPDFSGGFVTTEQLYRFARLTSICRARAKIQNEYQLFLASPEVRQHRGKLDDDARDTAVEQRASYPIFAVYADESGKTQDNLVVGSIWFLHGPDTLTLLGEITRWRKQRSFNDELHFKNISRGNLDRYKEIADLVAARSETISFKAISVSRRGIDNIRDAYIELYYLLLVDGVAHENDSGRGPLPRRLQLWKDAEEAGYDKILMANVKDRLAQAGKSRFDGQLEPDEFEAVPSKELVLIQIADLFTSSVNRTVNRGPGERNHKDAFADYFLNAVGSPSGFVESEVVGDKTYYMIL